MVDYFKQKTEIYSFIDEQVQRTKGTGISPKLLALQVKRNKGASEKITETYVNDMVEVGLFTIHNGNICFTGLLGVQDE